VFLGCRHAVAEHWANSANPDQWLRAARWEPRNAENWYRLGRYRHAWSMSSRPANLCRCIVGH
jgi:hypothetical protein